LGKAIDLEFQITIFGLGSFDCLVQLQKTKK